MGHSKTLMIFIVNAMMALPAYGQQAAWQSPSSGPDLRQMLPPNTGSGNPANGGGVTQETQSEANREFEVDGKVSAEIDAMMNEAPSIADIPANEQLSNTSAETRNRASSPQNNGRGIDQVDKKLVLSSTNVDARLEQLMKVSGEWKISLFMSQKDIARLQKALNWRQQIEQKNPEVLIKIQDFINPEGQVIAEKEAPVKYEIFRLKSIVLDPKGGWTIFLNDQKLTRKTKESDSEVIPISVNNRSVTLKWTPSDTRLIDKVRETAQGMTPETRKTLPQTNRIATTVPASNVQASGSIIFTLRPNQSFVPQYAAIYEGLPPASVETAQQETTDGPSASISPEDVMMKFPGSDAIPSALNEDTLKQVESLTNSLSSIIGQTRKNADRLQQ
ncbi:MAG: hypothetical protein K2Q12_00705 [Rickettsiales bacterium]|nr:hypothetical protein [Rickettsiales bacterium]